MTRHALLNPDGTIKRVLLNVSPRLKLLPGERVVPHSPPETAEQLAARMTVDIQERLDAFARTRGYDNIMSAASYAISKNPKFRAEGERAADLRDATWAAAYGILAQVQAGQRPPPATLADIEADLPVLTWPSN